MIEFISIAAVRAIAFAFGTVRVIAQKQSPT
jgi:hypothetical protein